MQLAKITGYADSITKSDDLYGAELLVAVPVDMETMSEAGKPFLLADKLGARRGQVVVYAAGTPYAQGGASIDTVVAIPETLRIDGQERFRQIVEEQQEAVAEPEHIVSDERAFGDFDPVSDLTEEFRALHREIDSLSNEEEPDVKTTTNTVPYEEYAKYLTTDFEPVAENTSAADRPGYSRVGYRSGRNK